MSEYENVLMGILQNVQTIIKTQPLMLGGYGGADGGIGGPPGGFIGYLPQWRVAYDSTELARDVPASGVLTLVDNLNHIRKRISDLETTVPLIIQSSGVVVASGVDTINFVGASSVTAVGNDVTVVISSSGGGGFTQGAKVYSTINQTIDYGSEVTLSFDTALRDTDEMFDAANPTYLTCKTAGVYMMTATAQFATNSTGSRGLGFYVTPSGGGSTYTPAGCRQNACQEASMVTNVCISDMWPMEVGGTVSVCAFQSSGDGLAVHGNYDEGNIVTSFSMQRIG